MGYTGLCYHTNSLKLHSACSIPNSKDTEMSESILTVKNLVKRYRELTAVDGLDLDDSCLL